MLFTPSRMQIQYVKLASYIGTIAGTLSYAYIATLTLMYFYIHLASYIATQGAVKCKISSYCTKVIFFPIELHSLSRTAI